ncbi:unnamed protein product, partial [Mesorhabditis spiculigera]
MADESGKNHCSGHEKMTVNISVDGPVFWTRQVAYIYLCSCHFDEHEGPLMALMKKFEERVERVCMVDNPVDFPFLPDSLFRYMAACMPRLQFIYMRELDLEKINRGTVVEFAQHKALKKLIVHMCRNYEVLEDFSQLPQLLVVKGEIMGLRAMIGDFEQAEAKRSPGSDGEKSSTASSEKGSELDLTEIRTALEVADGQ